MKRKVVVSIVLMFLSVSSRSWSREDTDTKKYNLGKVIVSATKTEVYQGEIGSSTTVITAEELKKKGKTTLLEALRDVAGVSITQYGSFGGIASVYLRGSKPEHTLLMLDGIELRDPMAMEGFSFDFAHLLVDNIERIEIVRGSQSTLYGSDAMAGVINIITKKGEETKPIVEATFEGGSHNTFKESIGLSGALDKFNYSISALRMDSDGISKATGGVEKDGYENTTFSARLGYKVLDNANLDFVFRRVAAITDGDDGANEDDPNKKMWWNTIMTKLSLDHYVNPTWDHKLGFSYSAMERKYKDDPDAVDAGDNTHNWFNTDVKKFDWQHNVHPADWSEITAGFEYEEERGWEDGYYYGSARIDRKSVSNKGYFLQNQFRFFKNLFITPGVRWDDHELFGNVATYKVSNSYLVEDTGTRLKANWGTGFKAPSLYQLYSSYGSPTLEPEKSNTYDFGFEQVLFNNQLSLGATYFHNKFRNMVTWDSGTFRYNNIDNAKMHGAEFETSYKLTEALSLSANYSYIRTKDLESGKELALRPKNKVGLNLNWTFLEKGNLNLSVNRSGSRWANTANTLKLKAYTTVDLYSSYELSDNVQVFCRAENLFNEKYQLHSGYAMVGQSFYAGIEVKF